MSAATLSTRPNRMPTSRFARRFWLGSSTSPPLITRSNLSFGPMAARSARGTNNPDAVAARADETKWRRDSLVIGRSSSSQLAKEHEVVCFQEALQQDEQHGAGRHQHERGDRRDLQLVALA